MLHASYISSGYDKITFSLAQNINSLILTLEIYNEELYGMGLHELHEVQRTKPAMSKFTSLLMLSKPRQWLVM